ncbi:ACP S-malonyltransferase [Gemmatimonadota bacterium]
MNRRIAFLFPGQGAQYVGMGQSLHKKKTPGARELFEEAADVLGYDLKKIMFEGPEETLKQTIHTQPAILLHSVAVARALCSRMAGCVSTPHWSARGHCHSLMRSKWSRCVRSPCSGRVRSARVRWPR